MKFLVKHWFDIGGVLSVPVILFAFFKRHVLSDYQLLMWCSLVSLFFHQLEEYRIAGTFPGMINTVMYKSNTPDRYPLNPKTSFIINVYIGWTTYLLAALLGEKTAWLGLAALMISLGNIIAHTFLFNLKGKTFYNAGLVTCWLFFAPCVYFFIRLCYEKRLMTSIDLIAGIIFGITLNFVGVLKMIDWLADRNTRYQFSSSQMLNGRIDN